MERILALDVGEKRIGVAVSDELGLTAQPVGLIVRVGWGPDTKAVAAYAQTYQTRTVLCGLPLNMDGSEGAQAQKTRAFAQQLAQAGLTVLFWDERMTTVTAERALIEGGKRRAQRRDLVDRTAAAVILQGYLDAHREKERDKAMERNEENIVELIGEDGTPVSFEHLMTLEHQGQRYILLTPAEPETPDEEGSVVIMRISRDEQGEDCYIVEEDDEILDAVFNRFLELSEEEEDEKRNSAGAP